MPRRGTKLSSRGLFASDRRREERRVPARDDRDRPPRHSRTSLRSVEMTIDVAPRPNADSCYQFSDRIGGEWGRVGVIAASSSISAVPRPAAQLGQLVDSRRIATRRLSEWRLECRAESGIAFRNENEQRPARCRRRLERRPRPDRQPGVPCSRRYHGPSRARCSVDLLLDDDGDLVRIEHDSLGAGTVGVCFIAGNLGARLPRSCRRQSGQTADDIQA